MRSPRRATIARQAFTLRNRRLPGRSWALIADPLLAIKPGYACLEDTRRECCRPHPVTSIRQDAETTSATSTDVESTGELYAVPKQRAATEPARSPIGSRPERSYLQGIRAWMVVLTYLLSDYAFVYE